MWAKPSVAPQMLSGHSSSYAWAPRGRAEHTAEEGIRAQNVRRSQEEWPTGDFLRRVKWVLARPNVWVSEKARVVNGGVCLSICTCVCARVPGKR